MKLEALMQQMSLTASRSWKVCNRGGILGDHFWRWFNFRETRHWMHIWPTAVLALHEDSEFGTAPETLSTVYVDASSAGSRKSETISETDCRRILLQDTLHHEATGMHPITEI